MARNYKRDRRGRFARTSGGKAVRKPLTGSQAAARSKKIKRTGRIIQGAIIAGATVGTLHAVTEPSPRQRAAFARQATERITNANARGLGQIRVASRNRRGVYNVTTLR